MKATAPHATNYGSSSHRRAVPARARLGSRTLTGCVSLGLALLLIGCGSTSEPAIGVQTAPTTQPTTAETSSTFQASTAPGSTTGVTETQDPQEVVDDPYQQFSLCMRENGYPDFEDFTADAFRGVTSAADGAKVFTEEMLRRGVDLADPATGAAMEACQQYLNKAATSAPELPGADEQAEQQLILDFAECMRAQGVEDWPDPDFATNSATGYSLEDIQSFDYQDPKIGSAGRYCDPNGEVLALFGR